MATQPLTTPKPERDDSLRAVRGTLREVRGRIRSYVAAEGLAATLAAVGASFWAALALDWIFEPSAPVRAVLVWGFAAIVAIVFYRKFLRRYFARLSDGNLALLLERRYKSLRESVLTSIELDPDALSGASRTMLDATRREARRRLAEVQLAELFEKRPRQIALAGAALLTVSILGFAMFAPAAMRFGIDRLLGRTDELWPRKTHLVVEGFTNGERVVARGSDLDLVVKADTNKEIPTRVTLYYESEDGAVEDEVEMDREGVAEAGVQPYQLYKTPLRGLTSSLVLDIRGNDARLRDLKIRVVERPRISMDLVCKYPAYTGRADGVLYQVSGIVPLPQGTIVTVEAHADKALRRVAAKVPDGAGGLKPQEIVLPDSGDEAQRRFSVNLGRLDADAAATFQLFDTDGIDNTELLTLQAVPDASPTFQNLARKGVDTSVTAQARLPFVGKVADDYGISRLWFEYSGELDSPGIRQFAAAPKGAREITVDEALEVADLAPGLSSEPLTPGKTFSVVPRAQDNRELATASGGNVTTGDPFSFTIVSDVDLLRLLEGREIMLREQFKALVEKVTRDRDALVSVGAPESASTPEAEEPAAGELRRDRSSVIVDQVRAHTKENKAETLVVAGGFAAIVEEIINNRVADGEQLQRRLADDIAAPLKHIGERRFVEYEAKLTALKLVVDAQTKDPAVIDARRREAQREADAILVEMNVVLNKMQQLESFKEAVDLLRAIIASQKEVGEKTNAQRQNKARLLGD